MELTSCAGIGAVFYVEHTRHLFPEQGEAETSEEEHLVRAMFPVVYWLVLFSIVVHGLSIPALDAFYRWRGIQPIIEEQPHEVRRLSVTEPLPNNSFVHPMRGSVVRHNRFSRSIHRSVSLEDHPYSPALESRGVATEMDGSRADLGRRRLSRGADVFELKRNAGLEAKSWRRFSFDEGPRGSESAVEDVESNTKVAYLSYSLLRPS